MSTSEAAVNLSMRRRVNCEYSRLRKEKKSRLLEEFKNAWKTNGEEKKKLQSNAEGAQGVVPFWLCPAPPKFLSSQANDGVATATNGDNGHKQAVEIKVIYDVDRLPGMFSWSPIQQNMMFDVTGAESSNADKADGSVFDEDLLVELVTAVQDDDDKGHESDAVCTREKHDFVSSWVFRAVASVFPALGNEDQVKEKFMGLLSNDPTVLAREELVPNIDSDQAISVPASKSLNSYRSLFCRRCFIYNCSTHGLDDSPPASSARKGQELKVTGKPCGSQCFLLLDTVNKADIEGGQDPKHLNGEDQSLAAQPNMLNINSVWTGGEQSFFRVLARVFQGNHCAISQAMMTKTCRQVFIFASEDTMQDEPFEAPQPDERSPQGKVKKSKGKERKRHSNNWLQFNNDEKKTPVLSYYPCRHPLGRNCDENCSCVGRRYYCEKFCQCNADCPNRFKGCRCSRQCNTKQCPCFVAFRECDPDLCVGGCGADKIGDDTICKNVGIQRGLSKTLLLAPSDVAGWGIFIKDAAVKNDFISEYCGELIDHDEAERRGKKYDEIKCSYLFDLNEEFSVDATKIGNKIRFANHSSSNPNCLARVLKVAGDHRIGVFAKRNIKPGEELLLNYGYETTDHLELVNIERKSTVKFGQKMLKLKETKSDT